VRLRKVRAGSGGGSLFDVPCGFLDSPPAGLEVPAGVVQIRGWCLFPGSSVARVEVSVGDGPPRRARLAMPRPDLVGLTPEPAAPVAGFELMAEVGAGRAEVRATAHSADGRALELAPLAVSARSAGPDEDWSGRAAELRARSQRRVPAVRPRGDGVRLVAFAHGLPYGGASLYLVELLRRLVERPGMSCEVVALDDGPLRERLEALGIPVHVTDNAPVRSVDRYEGHVAELLAHAGPRRFDVALVNGLASFAGADFAERLGIPAVWALHESFDLPLFWQTAYLPGHVHPYVADRARLALGTAAAALFEAEATRRLYLAHADADRLITLPYGIELEEIRAFRAAHGRAEARRRLGLREDATVLLCLGTVEPRKSQAMLAEAFASIAGRHPEAVLALVGELDADWCADYTAALRGFVSRAGLEGRVRIEPVTADPYPWHAAADVHVCASDVEALPRSVLEAMAFETPVVSTDVFGVPEVIDHGVTGYLCPTRDAAALADSLHAVLSADPAEHARVGRAAADLVERRHDSEPYAACVGDLLEALARDPGTHPADVLFGRAREREAAR
jgi:D-inositol-3-phosphate glycosyltransferase